MNGAELLLATAAAHGVDACFANPGTTELSVVSALDQIQRVRPVLGLAEAVCTGAADGHARMTGRPAMTLLHMGPGLANGLAYLHNARRAGTSILNVVGDHVTWHVAADAPLTTDIAALADVACVSIRTTSSAPDVTEAVAEVLAGSVAGPSCLIVPTDHQAGEAGNEVAGPPRRVVPGISEDAVDTAAKALMGSGRNVLFLGGPSLSARGLRAADKIARATGCELYHETFPARAERGGGLVSPTKLPYVPAAARKALRGAASIVLAGAREPVSFFGYSGQSSSFVDPRTSTVILAPAPQDESSDVVGGLERLADHLGASEGTPPVPRDRGSRPSGALTPASFAATIAALQPENAVIVDESVTSGFAYHAESASSPPHTYLVPHVGGAIGHGLPVATGAAVACPDRKVVLLEADGSAMYTVQSLWTHAREGLDVTTVICANRRYAILQNELGRDTRGAGGASESLLNLGDRDIQWASVANGLGVPGRTATTADELAAAFMEAIAEPGPHLIEAVIE